MRRPSGDAGTIAPLVPIFGFVLLLLGGLVIDASRLLNARGRAVAYAEEAARAGAGAIEPEQAVLKLNEAEVKDRVTAYCTAIRQDAEQNGGVTNCDYIALRTVSDTDDRQLVVQVYVALEIPASLLGIVGVQRLTASGRGSARPFEGVDSQDVDSPPGDVEVAVPVDPPVAPPGVLVPVLPEPPPPVDPPVIPCPPDTDPLTCIPDIGPIFPVDPNPPVDPIPPVDPPAPAPVAP